MIETADRSWFRLRKSRDEMQNRSKTRQSSMASRWVLPGEEGAKSSCHGAIGHKRTRSKGCRWTPRCSRGWKCKGAQYLCFRCTC